MFRTSRLPDAIRQLCEGTPEQLIVQGNALDLVVVTTADPLRLVGRRYNSPRHERAQLRLVKLVARPAYVDKRSSGAVPHCGDSKRSGRAIVQARFGNTRNEGPHPSALLLPLS